MAKSKTTTVFFCQNCGYESSKWVGQCPGCKEWNTIIEDVVDKTGAGDCLNGVFLNLIANGINEEAALRIAVDTATESVKQKGIMNLRLPVRIKEREEI